MAVDNLFDDNIEYVFDFTSASAFTRTSCFVVLRENHLEEAENKKELGGMEKFCTHRWYGYRIRSDCHGICKKTIHESNECSRYSHARAAIAVPASSHSASPLETRLPETPDSPAKRGSARYVRCKLTARFNGYERNVSH